MTKEQRQAIKNLEARPDIEIRQKFEFDNGPVYISYKEQDQDSIVILATIERDGNFEKTGQMLIK